MAVAPRVRGVLGRARRVVVLFDDAPDVTEFVSSSEAPRLSYSMLEEALKLALGT